MPYQPELNIIFMIGVYFNDNGNWSYRNFIIKKNKNFRELPVPPRPAHHLGHRVQVFWRAQKNYPSNVGNVDAHR